MDFFTDWMTRWNRPRKQKDPGRSLARDALVCAVIGLIFWPSGSVVWMSLVMAVIGAICIIWAKHKYQYESWWMRIAAIAVCLCFLGGIAFWLNNLLF